MTQLVLASKSPRRKKLLNQLGLTFMVHDSGFHETVDHRLNPEDLVLSLAQMKAEHCAASFPDCVIVTADTLVVLTGKILGKPKNQAQAVQMLEQLSGRSHHVLTGVCLSRTDEKGQISKLTRFHEETKVTFAPLTSYEIQAYVDSGLPMDKAGAYGIQDEIGSVFVSKINGDYYNVVGLPIHKFYQHLKEFAPELLRGTLFRK